MQPLTLPEYRKMDLSKLPLKEQRRYWKLLNRQVRACVRMGMHAWPVDAYLHTTRRFFLSNLKQVIKEKNAAGLKL